MKNLIRLTMIIFLSISNFGNNAQSQMIANITEDVQTDFGIYHPSSATFTPNVPFYPVDLDCSYVVNFSEFKKWFNSTDLALLQRNNFTVKKSQYKQLYDVYNACTWNGTPIFVTTDAVLHTYHVLFDRFLAEIEMQKFVDALDLLTETLIESTEYVFSQSTKPETQEAARRNLAFFYVAEKLFKGNDVASPDTVSELVDSELALITDHDGFHYSPIFGDFSKLDYSQFQPRGHYTKNDTLKAYLKP